MITINKPEYMSDTEWHYFVKEFSRHQWSVGNQQHNASIFHSGWAWCVYDETRRSVGEELP